MHAITASAPIYLPWPPSANRCWRYANGMTLVSREARRYKKLVKDLSILWKKDLSWKGEPILSKLSLHFILYPPDRRRRDLDNCLKVLIDSLENARLFEDDYQIDRLLVEREEVKKGGQVVLYIEEINK